MANPAQCFYCFESLLASFEHRASPALGKVEGFWEAYKDIHESENTPEDESAERGSLRAGLKDDVELREEVAGLSDQDDDEN
jgi:AMME syndrome candidate gene 1 protein